MMVHCFKILRRFQSLVICITIFAIQVTPVVSFSSEALPRNWVAQYRTIPKSASWQSLHRQQSSVGVGWHGPLVFQPIGLASGSSNKLTLSSKLFGKHANGSEASAIMPLKAVSSSWLTRIRGAIKGWKRQALSFVLCMAFALSLPSGEAWAVTGGRAGGSFKSSRAPIMRSSPPSSTRSYQHRPSPTRVYLQPSPTRIYVPARPYPRQMVVAPRLGPFVPVVQRGISASDIVLVTGASLAIAYGVSSRLQQEREQTSSVLGPGFSVAKLTVSLNVPDRDAPDSILRRLQALSAAARTDTRKGVQNLISNAALELLRQEKSIRSAEAKSEHYRHEGEAERGFLRQSISQRSKFDAETEYKYGNTKNPSSAQRRGQQQDSKATEAVVTILLAIEGDSTQLPEIKSRASVLEALNRLAVDSQVDDCLLSGEISWAPELRSETLSVQDIYADYPSLFPL